MSSSSKPKSETPLGNLLSAHVTSVLAKNGIHTIEELQRAYPDDLMKIRGIGKTRHWQIETVLNSGKSLVKVRIRPPANHVKDSSLNGALSPRTVRALARAGIMTVEQLREADLKRLLRTQGFGIQRLGEIERVFFAGKLRDVEPIEGDSL
ncbi:MAG: helix-hairpin-helix domain-containing protein [Comamonas sp.]